jgi:hypothetical protein
MAHPLQNNPTHLKSLPYFTWLGSWMHVIHDGCLTPQNLRLCNQVTQHSGNLSLLRGSISTSSTMAGPWIVGQTNHSLLTPLSVLFCVVGSKACPSVWLVLWMLDAVFA